MLSDGTVLLPDNALSHIAAHTVVTLNKLNFEHPTCSPDLARSDCHLV